MKSFDQMADDFVQMHAERLAPQGLNEHSCGLLRLGYMSGLAVGFEICTKAWEPIEQEEKGL